MPNDEVTENIRRQDRDEIIRDDAQRMIQHIAKVALNECALSRGEDKPPAYTDALAFMKSKLAANVNAIDLAVSRMRKDVAAIQSFAERFSSQGPRNIVAEQLAAVVADIEKTIGEGELARDTSLHALDILEVHSFAADLQLPTTTQDILNSIKTPQ